MIKTLILDFDGTLVKTKIFVRNHMLKTIKGKRKVSKDEEEDIIKKLERILGQNTPFEEIFQEMFSQEWEEYLKLYRATAMDTKYEATEGMFKFVKRMKEKGVKLYILSNRSNKLEERLKQAGYNPNDFEIYSAPEGHAKPDKESYTEVLESVKKTINQSSELLVIGDHIYDYLGLPEEYRERFRAIPDSELQRDAFLQMEEFPKEHLFDSVSQLEESIMAESQKEANNIN